MSGKHSTNNPVFTATDTNCSIYDYKDYRLDLQALYCVCFDLGIYSVSKQGLIYPLILPKVIFSAIVIDHILMR